LSAGEAGRYQAEAAQAARDNDDVGGDRIQGESRVPLTVRHREGTI
jgi:hypothetical protein